MKKNKLLRLYLFFITVFACFILGNNVYGYQLKYKAFYTTDSNNNNIKGYVAIRTMGNTFGDGGSTSKWVYSGDNNNSFSEIEANSKGEYVSFYKCYQTYKLMLHSDYLSNYTSNSPEFSMGYDYGEFEMLTTNEVNHLRSGINNKNGTVCQKNITDIPKISLNLDGKNFKVYRNTYAYANGYSGQKITITDWLVSESWLKDKIQNNSKVFLTKGDGTKYTYISFPAYTNGPSSELIVTGEEDTFKKNFGEYYDLDTAYNAMRVVYKFSYWDANRGLINSNAKKPANPQLANVGQTIMNLYDNELYLPNELCEPQEVYIRHVDENGNLIQEIQNSSEVKIDSNSNESIIKNDPDNNKYSSKYQEYYKISLSDKLRASRSLVIANNGTTYKYTGYQMSNAVTIGDAEKANSSNAGTSTEVTTNTSKSKNVTIITFKYKKDNDINTPDTQGKINSIYGESTDKICENLYTPTDEDIKPYLITNKYLLEELKYELKEDNNKVTYKMSSFNVNKLKSGEISDNSSVHEETKTTGEIFGDESKPWTLLNGNNPSSILAVKNIDISPLTKFKNDYASKLPSTDNIETLIKNNKTTVDNFDTVFHIPSNRYNGVRTPKLIANYQAYNVLNGNNINKKFSKDANNTINVIVYNPLDLKPTKVTSEGVIDHTTTSTTTNVLQKNAKFTVSFGTQGSSYYSQISDTSKYLDYYYMMFDIDIVLESDYQVKEFTGSGFTPLKTATSGSTVKSGTLIRLNKDSTEFKALASSNTSSGDIVSQIENNVVLIGVSKNMPSSNLEDLVFSNAVRKYANKITATEEKYINTTTSTNSIDFKNYCDKESVYSSTHELYYKQDKLMYNDAYYFAMAKATTTNIGRIYDFEITDCSDIDYKSVFRKTSSSNVNELSGIRYFSGVKLFNIYTTQVNTLENRDDINISGTSSKKILPLGPYKSTITSYVSAPKLGYRISFDLKTSGFYDYTQSTSSREVQIKPTYYYVSKDGNTFEQNINLYYKNSSGKYEKFTGSNYIMYFKPNNGYRSIYNKNTAGNITSMSSQLEPLAIGSNEGFTLNSKMMSTSDNQFIQAWYGEFKLPNSTIAVIDNDISHPLPDGYIGVKFEILCIDNKGTGNEKILSYNQNNKNDNEKQNTTQWDYEGFLGFTNYGNEAQDITLQLEKGTWKINNSTYNNIKGTVVLFDTDNRAANDFE